MQDVCEDITSVSVSEALVSSNAEWSSESELKSDVESNCSGSDTNSDCCSTLSLSGRNETYVNDGNSSMTSTGKYSGAQVMYTESLLLLLLLFH